MAASTLGSGATHVVLTDSTGAQLVRLGDFDGDGRFHGVHDASSLWATAAFAGASPRAVACRSEGGRPVVYWLDDARDSILRGSDLDANGRVEPFEQEVYRDSGALDGGSRPRGLALTDDGAVWWCSDEGFAGVFRLVDANGDGDAEDPGEQSVMVDGRAAFHRVETDLGPRSIDPASFVALAAVGDAVLAYGDGADEALFRFEDLDGDGDVVDPGESRLFLNASGKNPQLPLGAEWAAGRLRSLAIAGPTGGAASYYGRLNQLAVLSPSGEPEYFLACDSSATGPFSTSVSGHGLNGLVYRAVDRDGDGDVGDPGEVERFYDGSHTSLRPPAERFDKVIGFDGRGTALFVASLRGSERVVVRLEDRNGDGDAEDASEHSSPLFDSGLYGPGAPFAAGGPFVHSLAAVPAELWAEPNNRFTTGGHGCSFLASGGVPSLHGVGRARLGTQDFACELRGVHPGVLAVLYFGRDLGAADGFQLPVDLAPSGWPGCALWLYPDAYRARYTLGDPVVPGAGTARHVFSIPGHVELVGRAMWMQWLVLDVLDPGLPIALTERGEVLLEP